MSRVGLVTLVLIAASLSTVMGCSGGSKPHPASPARSPSVEASVTPAPCPVEAALCDFARTVEAEARAGTLESVFPGATRGLGERAAAMLGAPGGVPGVVSLGCPLQSGSADCRQAFAVTLLSIPEDIIEKDTRGLEVLFFSRSGQPIPYALFEAPDPAERRFFLGGGDRDFDAGIDRDGTTPRWRFFAYKTGVPPPSPEPGKLGGPRTVAGATTLVMAAGDPYRIAQGEVWYFKYLCDACGPGPLPNLYRAYRAADGTLVIDDLKAKTAGLGVPVAFTADWKRGDVYLVTCEAGKNCYSLESADAEGDNPASVYKSTDGGITWKPDGTVPPLTDLQAEGGQVLATTFGPHFSSPRYWEYRSGQQLEPPQKFPDARPVLLPNGSIVWQANERFYDQAGGFLFGPLFAEQYRVQVVAADVQYQHTYLTWAETDFKTGWDQHPYYSYVGQIDREGQLRDLWALPGDTLWITGELPRAGDAPPGLFGRFRFGTSKDYVRDVSFGAVLTLADGKVHRFTELDDARPDGSFVYLEDLVTSVQLEKSPGRAPFYRVSGAGDCLNVREAPSLAARVLVCLADDVLVGGLETPPQTVGGIEWRQIQTPGGMLGWASTEFLK